MGGAEGLPYAIGGVVWPGLSKLIEECGEVVQVAGKIIAAGGATDHWDGSNLAERLTEELGDLEAAISFVVRECPLVDQDEVIARSDAKLRLFHAWHAEQRDDESLVRCTACSGAGLVHLEGQDGWCPRCDGAGVEGAP